MRFIQYSVIALLALFLATGCATITRGTKDTLVVESQPAGADVRLSNGMSGKTPGSFKLPRKESVVVTIEKEGYEPVSVNVCPQVCGAGSAGMAGNVLLGGLIGVAVDAGSGAMNDLKPNPIQVTLNPNHKEVLREEPVAIQEDNQVEERLSKLKEFRDKGVITEDEYEARRAELISEI